MHTEIPDSGTVRTLGSAIATEDHESLSEDRIAELGELTDGVKIALDEDHVAPASQALLSFWSGYLSASLAVDSSEMSIATLIEDGFEAGAIGVDLYQALDKLESAGGTDEPAPDRKGWAERLFELTNRHVAHLKSHQDGG